MEASPKASRAVRIGGWLAVCGAAVAILALVAMLALAYSLVNLGLPSGTGGAQPSSAINISLALGIVVSLSLFLLGMVAFAVGLAIYVLVPSFRPALAGQGYGSHRTVLASFLLASVLTVVVVLLLGPMFLPRLVSLQPEPVPITQTPAAELLETLREAIRGSGELAGGDLSALLIISLAAGELSLLLVAYLRIIRPKVISWTAMGLTRQKLGSSLAVGLVGGLAILGATTVIGLLLTRLGVQQTQAQDFQPMLRASTGELAIFMAGGIGLAAFAEETFFRGYVFRAYREQKGLGQAYLFSALFFALVHANLPAFLPLFVVGLGLADLYRRTGSLVTPMVAHGLFNTFGFAALLLGR